MEKTAVLKLSERKSLFSQPFEFNEYEDVLVITGEKRQRMLRKLRKHLNNENVIINHFQENEQLFNNKLKVYGKLSYKTVLPVINKICRQVAAKYALQIPFNEICIAAASQTAYAFILPLLSLSRLFTIITDEPVGKRADELYFEHGCIIRHSTGFDSSLSAESLIIRVGDTALQPAAAVPVIDITNSSVTGKNVLNVQDIFVSDDSILRIDEEWGGSSGLLLYDLTGKLPDKNAKVDINKNADRIFLLDMEKV